MNPWLFASWTLAVFVGGFLGGYHLFRAIEEFSKPDDNEEEA